MKHIYKLALIFLTLCFCSAYASAQTDTLRLYYNIDQSDVAPHQHKLDSAFAGNAATIKSVNVVGYADFLGSNAYNMVLSTNRANNIKGYLQKLLPGLQINSTGKGELPATGSSSAQGIPAHRRVDVIFELLPKPVITLPKPDTIAVVPPVATFKDTVFEAKIDQLLTLKRGEKIDIDELLFLAGRHYLTPASYKYANVLVEILKSHPKLKIRLIGHICCDYTKKDGFDYDNKKFGLSKYRAKFLYDYLVKAGIDESRLSYKGVGSTDPKIYPEVTPEDSDHNRRVEVEVVSNRE